MKEYQREKPRNLRFSLHDARINDFQRRGKDLLLLTATGYVDILEDRMVDGYLRLEDISMEDSAV